MSSELLFSRFKHCSRAWGDGSVVVSNCCSYRGAEFGSQHSHDNLKPSITPVSRDPITSSGLQGHQENMQYTYIHAGEMLIYIKINLKFYYGRQAVVVHTFNPSTWETEAG